MHSYSLAVTSSPFKLPKTVWEKKYCTTSTSLACLIFRSSSIIIPRSPPSRPPLPLCVQSPNILHLDSLPLHVYYFPVPSSLLLVLLGLSRLTLPSYPLMYRISSSISSLPQKKLMFFFFHPATSPSHLIYFTFLSFLMLYISASIFYLFIFSWWVMMSRVSLHVGVPSSHTCFA